MTNFGTPRPGGAPPPRQPLTAAEIAFRETFTRAGHLADNPPPAPESTAGASTQKAPAVSVFDEQAIRAALLQEGKDFTFQIFPIGEKPTDAAPGSVQRRELKIAELESERVVMRSRMLAAESAAGGAVRELSELKEKFDTLQAEMLSMKSQKNQQEGV